MSRGLRQRDHFFLFFPPLGLREGVAGEDGYRNLFIGSLAGTVVGGDLTQLHMWIMFFTSQRQLYLT